MKVGRKGKKYAVYSLQKKRRERKQRGSETHYSLREDRKQCDEEERKVM